MSCIYTPLHLPNGNISTRTRQCTKYISLSLSLSLHWISSILSIHLPCDSWGIVPPNLWNRSHQTILELKSIWFTFKLVVVSFTLEALLLVGYCIRWAILWFMVASDVCNQHLQSRKNHSSKGLCLLTWEQGYDSKIQALVASLSTWR